MNKVFLIGNLTRDPERTETSNGIAVCRFSIAVSRSYTGADGERKTDFFNCVAWRGLGETVARYVKKGNKIAVSGSIELHNYDDNEGVKRTVVEIVVQDVEFLTPKQSENDDCGGRVQGNNGKSKARKPQLQTFDDDDDIPF